MTAIAARAFSPDAFAQWTVLVSLAALSPLFGASLASIVTRCLVRADQRRPAVRTAIFVAAQRLAHRLSALALAFICLIVLVLHPYSLPLKPVPWSVLLVTSALLVAGQVWQVSLQPAMGWHYARDHAWAVTGATAFIRLGSVAAMMLAWACVDGDLRLTAAMLCAGAVAAAFACWHIGFKPRFAEPPDPQAVAVHGPEILRLAKAFAVWSAGSAAILYGLPAMMSTLAGTRYNAFYLAYTLNLVALGVMGSMATALMAPVTRLVGAGDHAALKRTVFWGPALTAAALAALLVGLQSMAPLILQRLAPGIAENLDVATFIYLLGFQTLARNLALVYSVILASAGSPRQLALPILVELVMVGGIALPVGLRWGDTAFLGGLGVAGLVTALVVAALAVRVVSYPPRDRRSILAGFIAVQVFAAAFWAWAGRT